MARPRTPKQKAEVSGATLVHPERFRDRPAPAHARPVGEPYAGMTDAQKAVWHELAGEMPWLNRAHRVLLRLACYHAARLDDAEEFGVSATQVLSAVLSKLGATPVDESRVYSTLRDADDPDDEFFRPH